MTIVPAILLIWETCELFFNKNALAGYKLWLKNYEINKFNAYTFTPFTINQRTSFYTHIRGVFVCGMMGRFVSESYKINSFIICNLIWASCINLRQNL